MREDVNNKKMIFVIHIIKVEIVQKHIQVIIYQMVNFVNQVNIIIQMILNVKKYQISIVHKLMQMVIVLIVFQKVMYQNVKILVMYSIIIILEEILLLGLFMMNPSFNNILIRFKLNIKMRVKSIYHLLLNNVVHLGNIGLTVSVFRLNQIIVYKEMMKFVLFVKIITI